MAAIKRLLMMRHYRGTTNDHVIHRKNGTIAHQGVGQAFWFRALPAALSEVPADDRELPALFHARTSDLQDVTVQATVGYRFADPQTAATHLNFTIDPDSGAWLATPLDQTARLLTELAQQYAIDLVAAMTLADAMTTGIPIIRDGIAAGLTTDQRLTEVGIAVAAVRVVALRPDPDLERALQTPARELVQEQADKATYQRRALAVERERAISENELQNQIELAAREKQLVGQQGANARLRATEDAAALEIEATAVAERDRLTATVKAEEVRLIGMAKADAEAATMAAYRNLDPRVMLALALRDVAGGLPEIGTLNLSPDVLTTVLAGMTAKAEQ